MATENKKYIPALRFPEFQNDGEWNYEYGNMLYDSIVNKKHKSDLPILAITQDNGAIPRDEINYRVIVNDKSIEGYKIVEIGDFIISLRSFQGGIEYSRYKGLCSPAYIVLRKKHSKICDDFYRHYFKSFQYIQALNRNLEGIRDGKMVSYKQFSDIKLPCPSLAEQKKIADCLSSLDKYIDAAKRKLEQLKEHKKGLMQRLFPAKGKTTPELRFPEFQNDGEWKNIKFSELFTFISNNTLSRASLNNNGGVVQNIHYGDVLIKYKENLSAITEKIPFITDINDIQKYISVKLENGDIIIADTAEDEIVGKCTEIQDITKELIVAGLHTIAIRPNCKFAKYYLGFYLNSQSYRDQLTQYMQGVKVLAISKTSIAQTTICFPNSLVEQEHIANCLMEINNSLKLIEEKIKVLELHKKGLMQQLFPKL